MLKRRIGLVVNEGNQPAFMLDFIKKNQDADTYTIETLVVKKSIPMSDQYALSTLMNAIKNATFSFIKNMEKKLISKMPRFNHYFKPYAIDQISIDPLFLTPLTASNKVVTRYAEEGVNALKNKHLDLLILSHDVVPDDTLLSMCSEGIIFINYPADNNSHCKNAPGFWEVLNQSPATAFEIQQLIQNKQGQILFKGKTYTAYLYVMNAINLYQRSYQALHEVLEKLGKLEHQINGRNTHAPVLSPLFSNEQTPSICQQIAYVFKTGAHLFKKKLRKFQRQYLRWGVAYQFVDDWQHANLAQSIMVKNPPNRFLADPFIIYKNGAHFCYLEDYDYASKKGKVTVYQVSPDGFVEMGTALEENFHLSYPYLFEEAGSLFMCPETYQANEIRLYQCVEFPLHWKLHQVLKSNVSAADTNIFKFNGKWWMLTNIDSLGFDEHHAELHLFYADTFDATDWTAHPLNPIIFDPLKARNGGLLFKNNEIYRVFQVQGFDNYGESMEISKITALSTEKYSEEWLYHIPADFFNDLKGTHTYSFNQGLLVLDYKKLEGITH